jgi:hypothetical protein
VTVTVTVSLAGWVSVPALAIVAVLAKAPLVVGVAANEIVD